MRLLRIGPTLACLAVVTACTLGCFSAGLGESCDRAADCESELQCFGGICTHACQAHFDCGEGYLCNGGKCERVESSAGDACARELDCGPGQACRPDAIDNDDDGYLAASCQLESPGAGTAVACVSDADCRGGTCAIGHCTQLCRLDEDCPLDLACKEIPRATARGAARLLGCIQGEGVLKAKIAADFPYQDVDIAVPAHARSMAIVSTVDTNQLVGLARLTAPTGEILYATPFSPQEYLDNPIRYEPGEQVSTALIPNTAAVELEFGIYRAEVGSFLPQGGVGTAVPTIEVLYKLDAGRVLDLHFHFLNLDEHPCETMIGGTLTATTAQTLEGFQTAFLGRIATIFDTAGIEIGALTYEDVLDRPDLDGLVQSDLGSIASIADGRAGLHIFFVRSIDPVGIQALATGIPGAPRTAHTAASAITLGLDTLCYRSWTSVARLATHAMAHQMGLFNSISPEGVGDPIADTDEGTDNLMYFGEFGGTTISAEQASVLGQWPGLR